MLHKNLVNWRHAKPALRDFPELDLVRRDAAAASAQRERRAHDERIADLRSEGKRAFKGFRYHRGDDGLADCLHGVLEALAILRPVDGVRLRAEKLYAVLLQKPLFGELHGERKPRLPAERGQDAVRLLLFDDAPQRGQRERLDVNMIRHVAVRHDGGGVGIDEDDLHPCIFKHFAGLRAGIIKLRGLADDDGPRADDKRAPDVLIERH